MSLSLNILRAAAPWCETHKDALLEVAEPSLLEGWLADGDALEAAASAFVREKRDAIDLTPRRDALLASVRQVLTAITAAIRLNHKGDQKALRAVSRRFVQSAPSSVRSLDSAQRATNRLITACVAAPSAAGRTTQKLHDRAEALRAEIKTLQADYAREGQEYSNASDLLDTLRAKAIKRLATLQLAAETVSFENIQPLRDLQVIFKTHNPTAPSRSTSDDLLEDDGGVGDLSEPGQ